MSRGGNRIRFLDRGSGLLHARSKCAEQGVDPIEQTAEFSFSCPSRRVFMRLPGGRCGDLPSGPRRASVGCAVNTGGTRACQADPPWLTQLVTELDDRRRSFRSPDRRPWPRPRRFLRFSSTGDSVVLLTQVGPQMEIYVANARASSRASAHVQLVDGVDHVLQIVLIGAGVRQNAGEAFRRWRSGHSHELTVFG